MRPALVLLLCAVAASAQQQPPQPAVVDIPVYVTAIDVIVDVRDSAGNVPAGLEPGDFIVIEEGVERKVIGVDYLRAERAAAQAEAAAGTAPAARAKPWQTVLYFETDLSNGRGRRQTAKELSKYVDRLVQMGTVDVIFANPRPTALLQSSRDAAAVRNALQTVAASGGSNQLALHRLDFMNFVQNSTELEAVRQTDVRYVMDDKGNITKEKPAERPGATTMSPNITAVDVKIVRPYIEQEVQLVNRFRRNLVAWLSNYGRYAPRTLIMVTDGYDLDPLEYYSSFLNKGDEMELKSYVTQSSLADSAAKLATSLASAGWTTVSVQGDTFTDGWIDDAASTSGVGRIHKNILAHPQMGPQSIFYRPADPLRKIAEDTGGEVVGNSGRIAQAIERIDDRVRITYQVDRKPDGKARNIELRARDRNLKVRAARWSASATPDEMAEQRALGQLQEGGFTGDLKVDATVDWTPNAARKQGTMRVVTKLPGLTKGDFRFTLAVLVPPKEAFVTNRRLDGYKLSSDGGFILRTPVDLPPGTSVIVVSIEEIATGMWGSARIQVP